MAPLPRWPPSRSTNESEPKARQQIQRKELSPPFHLPPTDDDIAGAPGPKKEERRKNEYGPSSNRHTGTPHFPLQIVTTPLLSHILGRRDPD